MHSTLDPRDLQWAQALAAHDGNCWITNPLSTSEPHLLPVFPGILPMFPGTPPKLTTGNWIPVSGSAPGETQSHSQVKQVRTIEPPLIPQPL